MCGFLAQEINDQNQRNSVDRGGRRDGEDIETHQQDENEDEIEQIVDRIFEETNSDTRSKSPVGSRRAAKSRTPPVHPSDDLEVDRRVSNLANVAIAA